MRMNNKSPVDRLAESIPKEDSRYFAIGGDPIGYEDWMAVVHEQFPDLTLPTEAIGSSIAQLWIQDIGNPFALVLIGPASSGKTITANFFTSLKEVVESRDNFTPASFVSQAANVSKEKLAKVDLLPQIKNKTLVVRDLAPIFGGREEDVQKHFSTFVRVLDGEGLQTHAGVHGKRGYEGDYMFVFIGCSTKVRTPVWRMMQNLGTRIYMLINTAKEKDVAALVEQNLSDTHKVKEKMVQKATRQRFASISERFPKGVQWNKELDDKEVLRVIAILAKLLAALRTPCHSYDEYEDGEEITVQKEFPDRANTGLYNLARGNALLRGKTSVSAEQYSILFEVALGSGFPKYAQIVRHMLAVGGSLKTAEVAQVLGGVSDDTATRYMNELTALGVTQGAQAGSGAGRPANTIELAAQYQELVKFYSPFIESFPN